MVERKWAKKAVQIDLDGEECGYTGSEALMKEVWVNLLDNAAKFSLEGSTVEVRLRQLGPETVVTVRDSGPGMDETTQMRIFDQFYQGDTSHCGRPQASLYPIHCKGRCHLAEGPHFQSLFLLICCSAPFSALTCSGFTAGPACFKRLCRLIPAIIFCRLALPLAAWATSPRLARA